MQSGEEEALSHLQAGLRILHGTETLPAWARESLVPIYRRQTVLLLKFHRDIDSRVVDWGLPKTGQFNTLEDATGLIDQLYYQVFSLGVYGSQYRYGHLQGQPIPPEASMKQMRFMALVRKYQESLLQLQPSDLQADDQRLAYSGLRVTLELCWVMAVLVFEPNETAFDQFTDAFQSVLSLLEEIGYAMSKRIGPLDGPVFRLETGFLMATLAVIFRCRQLPIRLRALALLRKHSSAKEGLWDTETLYRTCMRIVEVEHGLVFDKLDQTKHSPPTWPIPPEEQRVHDARCNIHGSLGSSGILDNRLSGPPVFVMRNIKGEVYFLEQPFDRD
jgi:hypothetical protein